MSVSFENKETNRGVLTFTISQDQIKPELDRVFNSVKKSLNVPGFRKGHLPRPIFDKIRQIHRFFDVFRQMLQILCRNQARPERTARLARNPSRRNIHAQKYPPAGH